MLALFVVLLLDAFTAKTSIEARKRTWKLSVGWAFWAAVVMAAAGALTRWATAWASALNAAVPRRAGTIDRGLIAYMAIYSALLVPSSSFSSPRGALQHGTAAGRHDERGKKHVEEEESRQRRATGGRTLVDARAPRTFHPSGPACAVACAGNHNGCPD